MKPPAPTSFEEYVAARWGRLVRSAVLMGADLHAAEDLAQTSDAVRTALRRLPIGQRQVIVLRFYADLTEQQTADALDVARGTVKSRTARALASLVDDPDLAELTLDGREDR